MRCLVTGGSGFIGSHLAEALCERGDGVTILDNFSTGKVENLKNFTGDVIEANVEDAQVGGEYDVIYHLAALARIQPSIDNPMESHAANLTGTLNMLQHAKKWDAKFIYSSSSSVYGEGKEPPFVETMPAHPGSPYALQKYTGEEYCRLFHELFNLETVIFRYFNVYGERQLVEGAYATAIGIFLRQKERDEPFTIFGTGEQRRDFTYVKDVVRANLEAVNAPYGVYNVGTGVNYSINEVCDLISKTHPRRYLSPKPGEYPVTLASTNKFANTFGWKPETKLQDWLCAN